MFSVPSFLNLVQYVLYCRTLTLPLKEEKVSYGLVKNISTFNPVKIAFIEWWYMFRDAFSGRKRLKDRLLYLVKPPGWKHDGTGKVSDDLRQEWLKSKTS